MTVLPGLLEKRCLRVLIDRDLRGTQQRLNGAKVRE